MCFEQGKKSRKMKENGREKKTEKIVQRKHQKFVCFSFVKYTECDYVRRTHLFLFFEKLYAWTSKDVAIHWGTHMSYTMCDSSICKNSQTV